jgi:PKD repeat protein
MKKWRKLLIGAAAVLLASTAVLVADDGTIVRKNLSNTPAYDTEYVSLRMLPLYVPAQTSAGALDLDGIPYHAADGTLAQTLFYAQPLIETYQDGPVTHIEEYEAFPGHGARDAYAAVSLDDGLTWKRTNLSNSAKRSSIRIDRKSYPGDTLRNFLATDGNKALFVWASKYCDSGSPNYAMTETERSILAAHLVTRGIEPDAAACTDGDLVGTPCLYLEDHFGVAGSQGVQSAEDLADEGYPLVGDYPYSCLWAARGVLLPPAAAGGTSSFVWFKAERLSSGKRSAERAEAQCVKGAGCVVTWQEDPDGVRPGHGDGPGEGWSGAIAFHQTDTWYSFVDWDDFDLVSLDGTTYGSFNLDPATALPGDSLRAWLAAGGTGSPKAAVPMSIPVRVTDNAMCTDPLGLTDDPYCYVDFDGSGTADFCAGSVQVAIDVPDEGSAEPHVVEMCVTENGRLMRGNTASTRPRLSLHGYSSVCPFDRVNPDACPIDRAWVSFSYEENKGLGDICDDGDCEVIVEDADKRDMGKNIWYHTFDMFRPELVSQGLMLNQPAVYPADWSDPSGLLDQDASFGYNFWYFTADPIYEWQAGLTTARLYQSEIARRASQVTQDWYDAGPNGTVAFNLWKQGIVRRGGPADIMGRRWALPVEFDSTVDNPYDYVNMECLNADGTTGWVFTDGSNPRYVKGFCAAPAVNLSGNTIVEGECGDAATCLEVFPINTYFDDLAMEQGEGIAKILLWQQSGPSYGEDPTPADTTLTNLDDTSWENPYDMGKGHRGFLAGDMVMILYAWTNNWDALADGHDVVNLYARRSFDGGQTWTTLPASFTHTNGITYAGDGTTTCEFYGLTGGETEYPICTAYAAGQFEQARDLSLFTGSTVTVLDPRYAPTSRTIDAAWVSTSSLPAGFVAPCDGVEECLYDDGRDPSRFHMVYETGITSAYDEGEADPLDLFYSRAVGWGDDYLVWAEEEDLSTCLPSADPEDPLVGTGTCNEFDALEGSKFSTASEAALASSPGGQFLYAGWYQEDFDKRTGEEIGIDAWFRRVMYLDADGGTEPGNVAPLASFTFAVDGLSVQFTDASSDTDGTVMAWSWSFGDGQGSTVRSPAHTYATAGTYTVRLTVTDDLGAAGIIASAVTVTAPSGGIQLTATGSKKGSKLYADLAWSGAASTSVDVYRNGSRVVTTANDGAYTDSIGKGTTGTYVYEVCEAGTAICSNEATVGF